jgi:hypothetical protein
MLCSSEQSLMGRDLDTKRSYKGDNAPQNILKIKCPRLAKNAYAMQHLLHHSIIYKFIYYCTMSEDGCISELIPTEQVTFFLLPIGYKFLVPRSDTFSTPVHGAPKGLLQTADSIFIEFVSFECKKACRTKRCSCFKANLKCTELCQCSNSENSEIDEELIDNC